MQIGYVQLANVHINDKIYPRVCRRQKKDLPDWLQLLIWDRYNWWLETTKDFWELYKHITTSKSQLESVSLHEDSNWLYYIHSNAIFPNSKANTRIAKDAFLCCRILVINSLLSLLLVFFIIFKRHFLDEVSFFIINRNDRISARIAISMMPER